MVNLALCQNGVSSSYSLLLLSYLVKSHMPFLTFKSKLLCSCVYTLPGSSVTVVGVLLLRFGFLISDESMAFASPLPFLCMWLFFFFLYNIKSTCWDQTHCTEGKNVRCFPQTIDDKLIVLKLVEKELFFFFFWKVRIKEFPPPPLCCWAVNWYCWEGKK